MQPLVMVIIWHDALLMRDNALKVQILISYQ
jgi:hypothetical protein